MGPKGAKVRVDGKQNLDVCLHDLPIEDKSQKKSESKKPIKFKPLFLKP